MSGQMKRYKESLKKTSEPILLSQCPQINFDLKGIMQHAKACGKKVSDLTEKEKNSFIK